MLGIDVAKSTVERYMVKRPKPASPTWRASLANHVPCLVSIDFFTVPTVRNHVLYVFVVLAHLRRRVLHFNVTTNPTAEWTSRQITEAFPWDTAPRYMIRDRYGLYGDVFQGRVKAMGIEEVLIAPHSPWQSYYHGARCHMSLDGDAPEHRESQDSHLGKVIEIPEVGGLHHRYLRRAA